ncbi:ABC transporter permease [Chloroflexota bacterium]
MGSFINQLFKYRELLYVLTIREIQIRYKQSILGLAWAIVQPLFTMLMFTLVFSTLLKVPSDNVPYPVFSYGALLFWIYFSNSLARAIPSLETNAMIIKKIYFPREFFPIAATFSSIFDLLIAAVIFLILMLYYDVSFTLYILYVPLVLIIQTTFTLGVCFFFSAMNAYYRDVKHALPILIQLWMYATPIIYPISLVPDRFRIFYMLNPMTGIIDSYRNILVKGSPPDLFYLGIAAAGSFFLFVLGYIYFKRIEMSIADII